MRLTGKARGDGNLGQGKFGLGDKAARPVQPLRLTYHHRDGQPSTVAAFVGDDSLWQSLSRIVRTRLTVIDVEVASLELPGTDRRELAARCETAVRGALSAGPRHQSALAG